ncbi:Cupin superfamily protein [Rheinheimera sp. A13L]|uniref:JmjC domain-containing protein n=1 Tax=Rheinheimera sp. A13L TaxID=506534 RepID=UPI000212509C|nr:cupin domain-containing protein [Rheinheimera sp. A13L]EGM79253.1 Cupin superfamily protein [Rheinheimera sp. A13L]
MDINFKVSPEEFLNLYQEKKPLLMKGCLAQDLISWQDVNQILTGRDVNSDDFKLSLNGIVPKSEYVESYIDVGTLRHRLNKSSLYKLLRQGATLIDNKIVGEPLFDDLAKQIAAYCGRQTVVSSYAAFGEKDSFRNHWDTRDVFVLQLIGRKKWTVYPPSFENPLFMQQSKDLEQSFPCSDTPYMEFMLEAGDIFYLPRGWWHNPMPVGEETFHLAVGTFPPFAINYVEWIMTQLPNLPAARKSLDSGEDDLATLKELADHMSALLLNPEKYQDFLNHFYASQRLPSAPAIDIFGNPAVNTIADDMTLSLNANKAYGLSENYLIANGMKLDLDDVGLNIVTIIHSSGCITFGELREKISMEHQLVLNEIVWNLSRLDIVTIKRGMLRKK